MKKWVKILLIVLLTLFVLWLIIHLIPARKSIVVNEWLEYRNELNRPLISAHRGGSELNPENTKMAFDYIVNNNLADIIELDVRVTKDQRLVIIHDETINDTALAENSEEVYVKDCTYQELLNYNFGKNFQTRDNLAPYKDYSISEAKESGLTIMLLEEFLALYEKNNIKVLIEIKDKDELSKIAADKIMALLNGEYSAWKKDAMIISFTDSVINYIVKEYPDQLVGALGYKIIPEIVFNKLGMESLFKANYSCIQTKMKHVYGPIVINVAKKSFVEQAHERNQTVAYWTVNDVDDMKTLIEIGADIITTDAPDKLQELLK